MKCINAFELKAKNVDGTISAALPTLKPDGLRVALETLHHLCVLYFCAKKYLSAMCSADEG